jgi:serine/threonine-protein kinase
LNVELPVLRRVKDQFISETLLDLSNGGVALQSSDSLAVGALEELTLTSADRASEVTVQAEVVHVHPSGQPGQFVNGLRFAYLDAAAVSKIEGLILQAMATPSGSRAGARLNVQTEGFWAAAGAAAQSAVQLLNSGLGGALVQGPEELPAGALGLLSVRPIDDAELVAVPGRVVWSRKQGDGALSGIAFDASESSREFVLALIEALLFTTRTTKTSSALCHPGTVIGGFELGALIARGRSAEIYRARTLDPMGDAAGSAEVALRRFVGPPTDVEVWTERFLAAQDIGRTLLTLPGVLRVFAAAGDRNECWLATELLVGASLDRVLAHYARSGANAPIAGILSVMVETLRTLDACHALTLKDGIPAPTVHGDLRPSSVLLGNAGELKLIGFGAPLKGLAPQAVKVSPDRLPYLPPELYVKGGNSGPAGDVYQAGVLLYEALTGVTPFPVRSADRLEKAVQRGPVAPSRLNAAVPPPLERLVLSALALEPSARPASAKAFADQLAALDACPSDASAAAIERVELVDETKRRITRSLLSLAKAQSGSAPITVTDRPTLAAAGGDAPTELRTGPDSERPTVDEGAPAQRGPRVGAPGAGPTDETKLPGETASERPPLGSQAPAPTALAEWKPRSGALSRGDVLGRYEILGKLAQGGMAEVYLARSAGPAGFNKTLVLKTILPTHDTQSEFVKLFLNEARVAAVINHANIVQLFDFGFDRRRPYIAMEYLEGRNLAQVMAALRRQGKTMPAPIAARIIAECCSALDYAHHLKDVSGRELHVVHRDVSAKNILLAYSGQVKLLDFGIAKTAGTADITSPGMVRGTVNYLSPEQARGQPPTLQVDVWALGINLYAMLTGETPFDGDNLVAVMQDILHRVLPLASSVSRETPEPLARIAQKALEKQTTDRYATADAMRADLEEYLKAQPASANDLSALMESLFPAGVHPERVRMANLAAGLVPPELQPDTQPRSPPSAAKTEIEPSTQVVAARQAPTRKQYLRALAIGLLAGLVAAAALLAVFRPTPEATPPLPVVASAVPDAGSAAPLAAPLGAADELDAATADAPDSPDAAGAALAASDKGSLHITCNVPCTVSLDGRAMGAAPFDLDDVAAGRRRVKLQAATPYGRSVRELEVDIVPGQPTVLSESFGTGTLRVSAHPPAEVFIGGKSYGFTPITAMLLEGTHEVLLVNKKLKAKRHQKVVIKPERDLELSVDLAR